MNRQQLTNEAVSHYSKQVIKQVYKLVFGLDILGNPYGLICDVSKGVETFFYEPIQVISRRGSSFVTHHSPSCRGRFKARKNLPKDWRSDFEVCSRALWAARPGQSRALLERWAKALRH